MADFCYDCTAELWQADNGPRNDMVHSEPADDLWYLCESCGLHLFTAPGKRRCGRPQSDFHDDRGRTPQWPEPCATCIEVEGEVVRS